MTIDDFKTGITTNITNKITKKSISPVIVGDAFTDLADIVSNISGGTGTTYNGILNQSDTAQAASFYIDGSGTFGDTDSYHSNLSAFSLNFDSPDASSHLYLSPNNISVQSSTGVTTSLGNGVLSMYNGDTFSALLTTSSLFITNGTNGTINASTSGLNIHTDTGHTVDLNSSGLNLLQVNTQVNINSSGFQVINPDNNIEIELNSSGVQVNNGDVEININSSGFQIQNSDTNASISITNSTFNINDGNKGFSISVGSDNTSFSTSNANPISISYGLTVGDAPQEPNDVMRLTDMGDYIHTTANGFINTGSVEFFSGTNIQIGQVSGGTYSELYQGDFSMYNNFTNVVFLDENGLRLGNASGSTLISHQNNGKLNIDNTVVTHDLFPDSVTSILDMEVLHSDNGLILNTPTGDRVRITAIVTDGSPSLQLTIL